MALHFNKSKKPSTGLVEASGQALEDLFTAAKRGEITILQMICTNENGVYKLHITTNKPTPKK